MFTVCSAADWSGNCRAPVNPPSPDGDLLTNAYIHCQLCIVRGTDSKEKSAVAALAGTMPPGCWWPRRPAGKLRGVKFLCYVLIPALLGSILSTSASAGLKDQFGAPGGLNAHAGEVQLAIVVTAKRLRRLKPWEQEIRLHYPDLPVIRVADIPRTAPVQYEEVAAKLKKRLPEDLLVLIDLEGSWAEAYNLDVSVPNLLIFNAQGRLLRVHTGMYRSERFIALRADLDAALNASQTLVQSATAQEP